MAISYIGPSQRMAVTAASSSVSVTRSASQVRLFNSGTSACRVAFDGPATDSDPILPAGGWETRQKDNAVSLSAKCDAGQTTTLDVVCCAGD